MMEWIDIKNQLPILNEGNFSDPFVLVLHSVHGLGLAQFFRISCDGLIEELEEDYQSKYVCSVNMIIARLDGNGFAETDNDINIFESGAHFKNLGTITHWMPLPKIPLK